ncbi:Asparagine--tRNA ligase, chloroplastic/mitochondrial [Linum grandiflorum]
MAAAAAAAFGPATTSLRLGSYSTLRFLKSSPRFLRLSPHPHSFPPKIQLHRFPHPFSAAEPRGRLFCSLISGALQQSGERLTAEDVEQPGGGLGNRVGEFRKKLKVADVKGGPNEGLERVGQTVVVMGWVKTLRLQSSVTFMEVNDGSCLSNMQCVLDPQVEGYDQVESGAIITGVSVSVQGTIVESQGSKQKVELKVNKLVLVARVRNALAYATHKFFQENGFVWVSSPIITASDCEGAGEQFCVTTLIPGSQEVSKSHVDGIPKTKDGLIDWSQDFFGKPAFLTVSGQLNAETYATALSDVYAFGPTFRAENSNTSRHLAEFWMIEPELAFADLNDDMACATAYLQ